MSKSPFRLDGKTILITGASSGIGRATAIECAAQGAARCILVARSEEKLKETADLMPEECEKVILPCDLSNPANLDEIFDAVPKIDGLVCNAGANKMQLVPFYNEKDIENIFSINCFSPMLLVKGLLKKKKLSRPSSIVFTASISGFSNVSAANGIYGASKSALTAYMKYAALELAPKNIRVNSVHPGRIETPLVQNNTLLNEDAVKADISTYPLRRYGRPEEVAYAIIYLLSDAAAWVTGTSMVIDGGKSLV